MKTTKTYGNDELYHYGILGMRWGKRKAGFPVDPPRELPKTGKRKMSEDAAEAAKIKKKKVSEMSNAELNKLNTRQNLERSHKQLNPSVIKKGLRVTAGVAAGLGTIVAIHTNGGKVINIGKDIVSKFIKR